MNDYAANINAKPSQIDLSVRPEVVVNLFSRAALHPNSQQFQDFTVCRRIANVKETGRDKV